MRTDIGEERWQEGWVRCTQKNITLPLTSKQSIPDSVEKHSTCPRVCRARFESRRRSPGDGSMCFSCIDGKAPQSPVIKTDCQMAIKVMDLPGATSISCRSGEQTIHMHSHTNKYNPDMSQVALLSNTPWSMDNKPRNIVALFVLWCPSNKGDICCFPCGTLGSVVELILLLTNIKFIQNHTVKTFKFHFNSVFL